jgi:hypothetical protein
MAITLKGGEKLKRALEELSKKVSKSGTLRVGFWGDKTYPDSGALVAAVAAFNEFGVPSHNQPPRPFFRLMIKAKSPGWGVLLGNALKATDFNTTVALGQTGEVIAGQLRESIQELTSPPLARPTLEKRFRGLVTKRGIKSRVNVQTTAKPLIDTGLLVNSVLYEVDE